MIPFDAVIFFSVTAAILTTSVLLQLLQAAKGAARIAYCRWLLERGSHVLFKGEVVPVSVAIKAGWKPESGRD